MIISSLLPLLNEVKYQIAKQYSYACFVNKIKAFFLVGSVLVMRIYIFYIYVINY